MLGSRINRKDVYDLREVLFPATILIIGLIILNFVFGFIVSSVSNLDLVTSLFAAAPGGLSDMALIADDLGADSPKVALLQLIRVVGVISIYPPIMKYIHFRIKKNTGNAEEIVEQASYIIPEVKFYENIEDNEHYTKKNDKRNLLLTLGISAIGGILGIILNVPAGAMVFSMIAAAAFNITTGKGCFPRKFRFITQSATGALIGSRMTSADIVGLKEILLPALVLTIGMMCLTFIIGYSIYKFSKFDLITALLASTPGGLTEITMMAEDVGADAPKVAVLHLFRLVVVISAFPTILKYVCVIFK
jgi:membrane AbrB-like protein